MKKISRLFATALVLLGAAACNPSEINTPDNPDTPVTPDQPEKSGITITASIPKTRVSYFDSPSDDDLHQAWETNDVLFGFYQGDPSKQIVFTVSSVDSQTGVAVLKPEVGGEWIASATDGDVYLIYTGLNTGGDVSYNYENLLFSENSFDVNTASQTGGRIPACMHAHALLQIDGEGNKSLEFIFQNDCAIIELAGLTGIKEDYSIPEEAVLSKISVTGLFLDGKYSYDKEHNVLTFGANGNESKTVEIDFGDNSQWKVDETGNISGPEKILIAVVPKDDFTDITVNAKVSGTENAFNYTYSNKKISYTDCYVIAPADVVAKTIDGLYFTTVTGAFEHAADLFKNNNDLDGEHNIVTLVRDCGFAGINAQGESRTGGTASIVINGYDATFDLNGHTLTLDGENEHFSIAEGYELVITDSKGKDKQGKYHGMIQSDPDGSLQKHVINNEGTLQIDGGQLIHNQDWSIVDNDGTLYVNDGVLFSDDWHTIQNAGEAHIEGGTIYSRSSFAISDYGTSLIINGGELYSVENHAIKSNEGASVTIVEAGKEDECYPLIYNVANNIASILVIGTATGTQFNMRNGLVYSSYGAIELSGNVSGTISGGQIESVNSSALLLNNGSCIDIYGGKLLTTSESCKIGAIRAFCHDDLSPNNTSLTVRWLGDTYDDKIEPLIYSNMKYYSSIEVNGDEYNYSIVNLSGGFIYCSRTNGEFFTESHKSSSNTCLIENVFGNFYSNKYRMQVKSNTYILLSSDYQFAPYNSKVAKLLATSIPVDFPVHRIEVGGDGTYNLVQDSTKSLEFSYHITTSPSGEDQQNSGTQSYHFNGFSW